MIGVDAPILGFQLGGDVTHNLVRIILQGLLATLVGQGRKVKGLSGTDEHYCPAQALLAWEDLGVLGSHQGYRNDQRVRLGGQVACSWPGFAQRLAMAAGALRGQHQHPASL